MPLVISRRPVQAVGRQRDRRRECPWLVAAVGPWLATTSKRGSPSGGLPRSSVVRDIMSSQTIIASTLTFALVAMTMAPLAQADEQQDEMAECNPGPIMEFVNCTRGEANAFIAKLVSGGVDEALFVFCAQYELVFGDELYMCYCWRMTGSPFCLGEIKNN